MNKNVDIIYVKSLNTQTKRVWQHDQGGLPDCTLKSQMGTIRVPTGIQLLPAMDQSMNVTILQAAKSAMQSGRGSGAKWMIEFEPSAKREIDPLMGWTSSSDTGQQVNLEFSSEEEAVAYAKKKGFMYTVVRPKERKVKPKAYADNFAVDRILRWTH